MTVQFSLTIPALSQQNSLEGWRTFDPVHVVHSKSLPPMPCMTLPLAVSPNTSPTPHPVAHSAAATLAPLLCLKYPLGLSAQSPATWGSQHLAHPVVICLPSQPLVAPQSLIKCFLSSRANPSFMASDGSPLLFPSVPFPSALVAPVYLSVCCLFLPR